MAFKMTREYRVWQITQLERAINGTKTALARQTTEHAIQAHEAYIRSCSKGLEVLKAKLAQEDQNAQAQKTSEV
jgi:hypothetical protein